MKKLLNKLMKLVIITGVVFTSITPIYANTEHGNGQGGGYTTGRWNAYSGSNAFEKFLNNRVPYGSGLNAKAEYVKNNLADGYSAASKTVEGCWKSDKVYFAEFTNGSRLEWAPKVTGSNLFGWSSNVSSAMREERAELINDDRALGRAWNRGTVVLICNRNHRPVIEQRAETRRITKKQGNLDSLADIKANSIERKTEMSIEMPIEARNWTAQQRKDYQNRYKTAGDGAHWIKTDNKMNELEKIVNDFNKKSKSWTTQKQVEAGWAKLKSDIAALDKKTAAPKISLSNKQKEGLSKYGGVFTIRNSERPITIKAPTITGRTAIWEQKRIVTYTNGVVTNRGPWKDVKKIRDDGGKIDTQIKFSKSSMREVNKYQILAVICNKTGLDKIARSVSGANVTRGAGGNGLVFTKIYNPSQQLPFGANGSFVDARYDKFFKQTSGCEFTCAPKLESGEERIFAKDETGKSITKNEGKFRYFRDNTPHKIAVNQWAPKLDSFAGINKVDSRRTIFNADGKGLDEFQVEVKGKNISGINHTDKDVKNFGVKSSWASDHNKDQEVSIAWGYSAKVKNPGLPNQLQGGVNKGQGGSTSSSSDLSVYCHMGRNKAHVENQNIRNIKPAGDIIKFEFVRAVGLD